MPNAALVFETALLILVAFLVGCVVGWLARRLTLPRAAAASAAVEAPPVAPPMPLVAAPVVAPLPLRPAGASAAERLAAAAGKALPAAEGEPPAASEVKPPPVAAAEPPPAAAAEPLPAAPLESQAEPLPQRERRPARVAGEVAEVLPPPREADAPSDAGPAESGITDTETAAREAVEGGWTPPRRLTPAPYPESEPDGAAAAEAAMAGARSALAAAQQATAALLEAGTDAESPSPAAAAPRHGFGKPDTLDMPRDGGKDDLTRLRGVTPALEAALNNLGIFHLDQMAAWDRKAVVWVENHLGLRGRIAREHWPEQARALTGKSVRPVRPRR